MLPAAWKVSTAALFPSECRLPAPKAPGSDEKGSVPRVARLPGISAGYGVKAPLHHLLTREEKEVNGEEIIN